MTPTFARRETEATASPRRSASKPAASALRIGDPNDAYEQEADRVADEVMSGGVARRHWSISSMSMAAGLQRKCSCGGSGGASGECEECREKGESMLQRKSAGVGGPEYAPPIVHDVLNSPGQQLDKSTRDFLEPRFGYDLSRVRLHSGSVPAESARAVRARAYTVGNHVVLADNWSAGGAENRRLLAHELTHTLQQSPGGRPAAAPRVVARAPAAPAPPVTAAFQVTAADLDHIEGIMSQLAAKLDPGTLKTLQNDKTLVIGLVEDADGELALVYTVSGDWINPALEKATNSLDITRWNVGEGRRPRGEVGAPGDAEQRMIEFADASEEFVVKGMVVSRKICPDCVEAIANYEHGPIAVRVGKLKPPSPPVPPAAGGPAAGGTGGVSGPPHPAPQGGGSVVEGGEIPKTVAGPHVPTTGAGAGNEAGGVEDEVPTVPKPVEAPKPPAGEVKPPTGETPGAAGLLEGKPSGIGTVSAEAGAAATEFSLSGAILGLVVEQAIFAAIALALQWVSAKLFELQIENEIETILKPAISAKFQQLEPGLKKLAGSRKLMVRISYDFVYQRDSPDDWFGSFMQGGPPLYEMGSMRLFNIHPGNEELDFASGSSEIREPILGQRERVTARSSYSVLLDDAPRRLREKQMAEIVEKHRVAAPPPKKASPPPPEAPPSQPLLPSTAPQQAPSNFQLLPGAPGPSPLDDIDKKVGRGRNRCVELIAYGEKLRSSSPSNEDIKGFFAAESGWRDMVTYWLLYYKNSGPDYGRSKCDELLNSDEYGGKLKQIRQTFGG